jgi:histidyl-tRNA synthetase
MTATGMGMGDCVLEILLKEKGLVDERVAKRRVEYFVAYADHTFGSHVYEIAARLRSKGVTANFSYKPQSGLSKQLKEASVQEAKKCIIVGQEFLNNKQLVIKDMGSGEQKLVDYEEFLAGLESK